MGRGAEVCHERLRHCDALTAKLDDPTRITVLPVKNVVCRHPRYCAEVAADIYDAVIGHGIKTVPEFWFHMASR